MYRKRKYGSRKYNAARERAKISVAVRAQNRPDTPPSDYPPVELPALRRRIIIETFDFGETVRHEILLYRTTRIDSYRVVVDGTPLRQKLGFARVLELIRKALPRLTSRRAV